MLINYLDSMLIRLDEQEMVRTLENWAKHVFQKWKINLKKIQFSAVLANFLKSPVIKYVLGHLFKNMSSFIVPWIFYDEGRSTILTNIFQILETAYPPTFKYYFNSYIE